MSEAQLPEEILEHVLRLVLSVSEREFCKFRDNTLGQGRGWVSLSTSAGHAPVSHLLLISRRWLRIGSPLLYEGVVLREQKHTKAVAHIISFDTHLGEEIKYLRLEGGLGKHLPVVLAHAPNVHTLYISLHVPASEAIRGLHKALSLVHPRKLYIYYRTSEFRSTKAMREAKRYLQSAIATQWETLVSTTTGGSSTTADVCIIYFRPLSSSAIIFA
ncbi:uncharacterized protein PHACADRAFT_154152 [Phanerochaete carnosa HHB-10118-sp]|uniref:F-box domain-containing protein n=1 Tax=Phanerochaete carnosa (strain HHB-10118-sp) TaxID=650164 RepID=K5VSV0_PHACS|nr:uncharacterized protein PHACADRAFT_154152 [Phanerochaete carnosa HHB-10118-sp]EKM49654.1 hypothetical protein PHACADRAFT_154152 [Phanerochaete carnosa HHB-10118-sp]